MKASRLALLCVVLLSCKDKGTDAQDSEASLYGLSARPENTSCLAGQRPAAGEVVVTVEDRYPGIRLSSPVALGKAPGQTQYWSVASKLGVLYRFEDDPSATVLETALDLTDRVAVGSEMGLLGFAYDPDFVDNGELYVYYSSEPDGQHVSRVSRFRSDDGGASFDPDTEEILLTLEQPGPNHNGGGIHFDRQGYLVIGFGDGGTGADPLAAQDYSVLLGSFSRIDVHPDDGSPYGIPADNPFVGQEGVAPELWAKGLRNPWGWSFDRGTGELWAGDVGWNTWEEVDHVEAGGNYGWPIYEGLECLREASCDDPSLIPPLAQYSHDEGNAITGGRVYRGAAIPELQGSFVYADHGYGVLWALSFDPVSAEPVVTELGQSGLKVSAFGEDEDGELYLLHNASKGGVYALLPAGVSTREDLPGLLSQTGCVDPDDPTQPASGLIPYELNAPFWSDGADKLRYLALPDGGQIEIGADGDLELPIGSVLMKSFEVDGALVETRLLMRHEDGEWAGYSYAWEGDDATLLLAGERRELDGGQTWWFPSRAECMVCHTSEAGRSLGLELNQLDRLASYPGGVEADQLATWEHIGLFAQDLPETTPLPDPEGDAPLEDRARATLHVNCSPCHRPDSATRDEMDLRWGVTLSETGACEVAPVEDDLGVEGAALLVPGAPERSLIALRLGRRDLYGMPPVGSLEVDEAALARIQDWILALESCEDTP